MAHTDRANELQDFFKVFQNLTANGGGDYEEYALHAILKALQETDTVFGGEYLIPGSHAIVITDAPSKCCLLYTSPSPRDATLSRMPSSA